MTQEGQPARRDYPSTPASPSTQASFWSSVIPARMEADKKRDEIHRIADDEIRTGHYSTGPRPASTREIGQILHKTPEPEPEIGYYDEFSPGETAPNFRVLARGETNRRSEAFQTGERINPGSPAPHRKPNKDRRDSEARGFHSPRGGRSPQNQRRR